MLNPFVLTVSGLDGQEVERKTYQEVGDADDDFELYVEIYGDECMITCEDTETKVAKTHHPPFDGKPSFVERFSTAGDPVKLVIGLPATMCHPNDRYAGHIADIRKNGRELVFVDGDYQPNGKPLDDPLPDVYTLRKDGAYRRKGAESPVLLLGVAHNYRSPEI